MQNYFRDIQDYKHWPPCVTSARDISQWSSRASLYREKNSHRGISSCTHLKSLIAKQVNQDFLEEISRLNGLEYLELEVLTAGDLATVCKLPGLRTLKIDSPRKISDFSPLHKLPSLTRLFIQNAKHLSSLEAFSTAHNLISLGIEGSIYTAQKIHSLKPLAGLSSLEALFLTNVRLQDKDLSDLCGIPNLKVLECARFAPKSSFAKLRDHMPNLECHWCDDYEIGTLPEHR